MKHRNRLFKLYLPGFLFFLLIAAFGFLGKSNTVLELTTDTAPGNQPAQVSEATKQSIIENYGKLPIHFEANQGQFDERVKFVTRGHGYTMLLTDNEVVLSLRSVKDKEHSIQEPTSSDQNAQSAGENLQSTVVRMKLVGANPSPTVSGQDELIGKTHYLVGERSKWHTNVSNYEKVRYEEIYPGIDLVYYGSARAAQRLEYDFVVRPGADPKLIKMQFDGFSGEAGEAPVTLDEAGNAILHIPNSGAELVLQAPILYQERNGERVPVDGAYTLTDDQYLAFTVVSYDDTRPLVIDPILLYSTFLGNWYDDSGRDIAVDASGNIYVTGSWGVRDHIHLDGFDFTLSTDAFVSKFTVVDAYGRRYHTILGGSLEDHGYSIALDTDGNAYVTGTTQSSDFPVTPGAFDVAHNGGTDAFVSKLSADGSSLIYSGFLGAGANIAVDASGHAYVARAAGM